jgi:maltooligosyltrehalose synthase
LTRLVKPGESPGEEVWAESQIIIPEEVLAGGQFRNVFTNEIIQAQAQGGKRVLILGNVFRTFPVVMLEVSKSP